MTRDEFISALVRLDACSGSIAWLGALPAMAAADAWASCPRGEWLVWLVGALHRLGLITRQVLVIVACAAARKALVHVPASEPRPRVAIETAERWVRGEAAEDVRIAYAHADAAADAAYTADAAAYDAARAARAAADAVNSAHRAARAAADAVNSAHRYERERRRAEIADAVRAVVPWATIEAALREVLP